MDTDSDLQSLAARKQLLVTRAALQRLHATNELGKLREKSRWVRSIATGAMLLLAARRGRLSRIAGWAGVALALLRLFRRKNRTPDSA